MFGHRRVDEKPCRLARRREINVSTPVNVNVVPGVYVIRTCAGCTVSEVCIAPNERLPRGWVHHETRSAQPFRATLLHGGRIAVVGLNLRPRLAFWMFHLTLENQYLLAASLLMSQLYANCNLYV